VRSGSASRLATGALAPPEAWRDQPAQLKPAGCPRRPRPARTTRLAAGVQRHPPVNRVAPARPSAGAGSPVSIEVSTAERPAITISVRRDRLAGTDGETRRLRLARPAGMRTSVPSRRTATSLAPSDSSARSARARTPPWARASSRRPSSTKRRSPPAGDLQVRLALPAGGERVQRPQVRGGSPPTEISVSMVGRAVPGPRPARPGGMATPPTPRPGDGQRPGRPTASSRNCHRRDHPQHQPPGNGQSLSTPAAAGPRGGFWGAGSPPRAGGSPGGLPPGDQQSGVARPVRPPRRGSSARNRSRETSPARSRWRSWTAALTPSRPVQLPLDPGPAPGRAGHPRRSPARPQWT